MELTSEEYISHYGVKGMRWGQRKRTKKEEKVRAQRFKALEKRRQLSDDDLKKYIDRLQNEKKLKTLIDEDLSPGKSAAKKILTNSGQKIAGTVATGVGMYAIKVAITKKFSPTDAADYIVPKPKKK